ncbi:MAG: hemophilus-specific protein, partial [Aquincola sp.]|nr:hemophilus-specific protein [Aquincola sp.]
MGTVSALPISSLVRVVSPQQLNEADAQRSAEMQNQEQAPEMKQLAAHIRSRMTEMKNFRNAEGIAQRLIAAFRAYKGMYDATQLTEIRAFGGSEVYARITSSKCRAATALLRDVYLSSERPWALDPTPVPTVPDNIDESINQLVSVETSTMQAAGQQVDQQMIADRVRMLREAAERAAKKQAETEADRASLQVDDLMREGGFYEAFAEFLIDLPIFPFACIKGPVVRRKSQIKWVEGKAVQQQTPKMFWHRVSPFDLYWSPGASNVMEAEFVERIRLTRSELLAVRGLPGYDTDAIDQVLARFSDSGLREWWDVTDAERARLEEREQWPRTSTQLLDTAEYHGYASGQTLLDWGMSPEQVNDPLQEYLIQAWLVDRFVIKVQINPSTLQR